MRFMLDTDTVSYAIRGHGRVGEGIKAHGQSEPCISAVTLAELRYGAAWRKSQKLDLLITKFTTGLAVVPFDAACAAHYAEIASSLERQGVSIGPLDTMIAAHALTLDLTLVTNNTRHFTRVQNLRVENWV
jgi:tRNA(fMet)-specific endonuclease VapC